MVTINEATRVTDHDGADAPRTRPLVHITMLGGFELVVSDTTVPDNALRRRDSLRLAKFLALAPNRRVHREQLVDALWPDAPFKSVANRLHKAAHFLRKATGLTDSVVLSGDTVALFPNADVETDVAEFERLAVDALTNGNRQSIERAIAMYAGDLLPHDPFDEWIAYDRRRLQLRHRELLHTSGQFDRLVTVDPTDEDAHVGVMRAMLHGGDFAGVLHQFEFLSRILDEELGVKPGSEAFGLRDLAVHRHGSDRSPLVPRLDDAPPAELPSVSNVPPTAIGRPGGARQAAPSRLATASAMSTMRFARVPTARRPCRANARWRMRE
jgi:DNA-binding SARP family transcriptional activator